MRIKFIFLTSVAIFLFACAPAPNNATPTHIAQPPAPNNAAPTSTAQSPAPTRALPTATAVSLGDDVLALYRKTGGIMGISETLVVHQGGLLEWTARGGATKTLQMDSAAIQPLRRMLEQNDFGALDPLYQALGADLFTYTISARDANGKVKTVTTMDNAQAPAYLGLLLATLEQLRVSAAQAK